MASKKPSSSEAAGEPSGSEPVEAYLQKLEHPLKPVLEAVRAVIPGAHSKIREGIKWNAQRIL